MTGSGLLARARQRAGLTQEQLATRAGTSRTAVSAYEHGRKSPTLDTAERLLAAMAFEFATEPVLSFKKIKGRRGRIFVVPIRLPRLPANEALGRVVLPVHLNWTQPGRAFDCADRDDRSRLYELVLTEGRPSDVRRLIDGVLLADLWNELVLPREVRAAWEPLIRHAGP